MSTLGRLLLLGRGLLRRREDPDRAAREEALERELAAETPVVPRARRVQEVSVVEEPPAPEPEPLPPDLDGDGAVKRTL